MHPWNHSEHLSSLTMQPTLRHAEYLWGLARLLLQLAPQIISLPTSKAQDMEHMDMDMDMDSEWAVQSWAGAFCLSFHESRDVEFSTCEIKP